MATFERSRRRKEVGIRVKNKVEYIIRLCLGMYLCFEIKSEETARDIQRLHNKN